MMKPIDQLIQSKFKFWKRSQDVGSNERTRDIPKQAVISKYSVHPTTVLKEFIQYLTKKDSPTVLDIGPVIGSNIEYFFNYGIKTYMEDFLVAYTRPKYSVLTDDKLTLDEQTFFAENFTYEKEFFDGLICWDIVNYLDAAFARSFVERISNQMKPNSLVMGFFHIQKTQAFATAHKYRVVDDSSLEYIPVDLKLDIKNVYQTRDISQLFARYHSQKFCLLKNNMLEVLLKKR